MLNTSEDPDPSQIFQFEWQETHGDDVEEKEKERGKKCAQSTKPNTDPTRSQWSSWILYIPRSLISSLCSVYAVIAQVAAQLRLLVDAHRQADSTTPSTTSLVSRLPYTHLLIHKVNSLCWTTQLIRYRAKRYYIRSSPPTKTRFLFFLLLLSF